MAETGWCLRLRLGRGQAADVRHRRFGIGIAYSAKLAYLPADITPHVLRHSFASLTPDLGYNEPPIATLPGYKAHSITSRYAHSAGAKLLAEPMP
jgi:site-specific recombinase XerD